MIAAWKPFSIASSAAKSAMIVLPLPTSPCRSRCIRRSLHMSAKISRSARVCAPVGEGDAAPTLPREAARALVQQLHEEELLEREAAAPEHRLVERGRAVHH